MWFTALFSFLGQAAPSLNQAIESNVNTYLTEDLEQQKLLDAKLAREQKITAFLIGSIILVIIITVILIFKYSKK
jgi:t-SNARE complex subunit (syntaxin)